MWENDPIVLQLISYMEGRGCFVQAGVYYNEHGLLFSYNEIVIFVNAEDIFNALHAAYRVEWETSAIRRRFERYLIDLHTKRRAENGFYRREGL